MCHKLVIVGGVAGGATAAARARRLSETAQIVMLERGPDISFANCGLPYHIGEEIPRRNALLIQRKARLARRFDLDIRTQNEVVAIDRSRRTVHVRELPTGREYDESYDTLLLSPGAMPLRPPIAGIGHGAVFTLRNMQDMDRTKAVVDAGARMAVVVGGSFIGLEMVENLRRRGLDVALVEILPHVLPGLDAEVAASIHQELEAQDVALHLDEAVERFEDQAGRVLVCLRGGGTLEADLVILSVGVRPDARFAQEAGLAVNERGALIVDEHMRTSDPCVYAVGDAVQVMDPVLGVPTMVALAGPANRQARIAVDNIFGRVARYRGTQGTWIVRVFGLTVGGTGASESALKRRGVPYRKVYVHWGHHAEYYPGAQPIMVKLLFGPGDGRLLGAQLVGRAGVDKRIDVLSVAIQVGMTVSDLEQAELAYAPQYSAGKDPINIVGNVASHLLCGDEEFVYAEDLAEVARAGWTILDVRAESEVGLGHIPGARLLPLPELRKRWRELPSDRPVVAYCDVGQRSYYASRILCQKGLRTYNLAGGYCTYCLVCAPKPVPRPWPSAGAVLPTHPAPGYDGGAAAPVPEEACG